MIPDLPGLFWRFCFGLVFIFLTMELHALTIALVFSTVVLKIRLNLQLITLLSGFWFFLLHLFLWVLENYHKNF